VKFATSEPFVFRTRFSKFIVSLLLFLLALVPRLLDLGRFLTADEFLWVDRSRNFLAGLTNSAYRCTTVVEKWEFAQGLACTLRTGHPGVTTMWTGSFGLWLRWLIDGRPTTLHDYVVAVSTNPLDATFIAPERLGTVLLMSLWVVAVYWLIRRLIGPQVALVAAVIIALDPFHIALSRVIHHDALSTAFMTLSVLTMLIYWGQKAGRRWLVLSGVFAGFGFLSKSPALFLMPFVAVVGLWFTVKEVRDTDKKGEATVTGFSITPYIKPLARTITDGLLWFAVSVAVVFIFWPAMWVVPLEALETVFFIGSKYATGGHAKGNYFLENISKDPGVFFYPVTWLYRTSPLVIIGIVSLVIVWVSNLKHIRSGEKQPIRDSTNPNQLLFRYIPIMLLFIFGFYLLMTIGEKKQDRYFLPAYPWLDLMAAIGFIAILRIRVVSRRISQASGFVLLLVTILIVNGFLVTLHYPYYFTYYNPLLGGPKSAAKMITVGWGEGLDLAADYLNHEVNPDQTRVSSWYQSTFAPFYKGTAISYSKEKGKALAGDYVIFYINQTQRRFPDDIMFEYFEDRFEPKKIITLHGVDYVWIYPSLGVDHYVEDQTYTGIASLLAWQWVKGDTPLIPGQPADFELYWEYLGKELDEHFFFRLIDQQGQVWTEGESRPVASENPPFEQWREGEIIVERGTLTPPPDMPAGQYQLQIGFYTKAAAVTEGELLFTLPPEEALITVGHAPGATTTHFIPPASAVPVSQPLGDSLTLLGATWPTEPLPPAGKVSIDLYWQVEHPLSADSEVHLGLMDNNGEAKQGWFNLTLAEIFNSTETTWQPGDVIHTHWQLDLLSEVPPGEYHFEVVLSNDVETNLSFGTLMVSEQ